MTIQVGDKVIALFHYTLMPVIVKKINKKTISVYGSAGIALDDNLHKVIPEKIVNLNTPCVVVARLTRGGYTYRIDTTLYIEKHLPAVKQVCNRSDYVYEEIIDGKLMYRKTDINGYPVNGANSWFPIPEAV